MRFAFLWGPSALGLAALGLLPGFSLRLIVRLYPKGDPRRREVVAELYTVENWRQPIFVIQMLELAISEGIPARWRGHEHGETTTPTILPPVAVGYRGPQVCWIVGITYRQLDYWTRTGLIRPSIVESQASGTQRQYSYQDLVELKVIKSLLDAGMALKHARRAIEYLRDHLGAGIASASLVLNGAESVLLARDSDELVDLVRHGQGVFSVMALDGVKVELDAAITELHPNQTGTD